ncbi:MAG: hypothetical protein NT154_36730 [Verrucomicrobia bacterium]|nr:hypothetical protein [Verrucomicrobiota bacterium]
MKTALFNRPRRVSGPVSPGLRGLGTAVISAWLLASTGLMAAPTVGTLNGGPAVIGFPYFGYLEGNPTASIDAQFHTPIGLALDSTGNYLYVADRDNNAIRVVDLASSSTHYNLTFTFVPDEFTPPNTISSPVGVALDAEDNLYVLNRGNGKNGTVLRFDYYGDFTTVALALTNANGMALDYANNIYVTISSNSLLKIPSGAINVTPGAANTTVVNYNFPAKTSINNANTCLQGIVVMDDGRIAACDSGNHGIVLINPDTHTNSLLTGFNGAGDYTGVNNRGATTNTAKFLQPYGLAKAGKGILVVSDYGNNRVKVVNSFGAVTNLYGVSSSYWYMGPGSYPGWWDGTVVVPDGEGDVEAREPRGLLLAPNGTIYVTEDYYHLIRTVAGADLPPVPPPPPPPPATPTILVVLTNYGQVSLTWSASAGASGYNVKRSPSSLGPFATIANTASTNFTDGSVLNGTTYYYVVSAVGAGGESPDSAPVSARTPLPPVDDPVTGYVDFPPIFFTSVFHPVSSIVFNNDTRIVIVGEPGSQTFYEYGPTGGSKI